MARKMFLKIAERVIWTFIQGAASTLLLSDFLNVAAWKAAAVGGIAAIISLVKNIAGTKLGGDPTSPAWLPASVTATGGVVGEVTGKIVSDTGKVVGEVAGEVTGLLNDALGDDDEEDSGSPSDSHSSQHSKRSPGRS